jgi:cellulose synthase/poly-beta-1,6-N-acetylglucosamine synthase-like glycosyltransferase
VLAVLLQVVVVYFLALNSFHALLLVLAIPEAWLHWRLAHDEHVQRMLASVALPPVSVLTPRADVDSVQSLLALRYPNHEVVVVCDGAAPMLEGLDLYEVPPAFPVYVPTGSVRRYYRSRRYSKLLVLDKATSGGMDGLNAALNAARYPYVLAVDAGVRLESEALVRLARPFLMGGHVPAVGATVRVAGGPRWLEGIRTVEYLRTLFERLGWNRLGRMPLAVSDAVALVRREHVLAVGGYRADLLVQVNRLAGRVPFVPDSVASADFPRRDSVGMLSGVVETLGYVLLGVGLWIGAVKAELAIVFLTVALGYRILLSLWALALEELTYRRYWRFRDFIALCGFAVLEGFWHGRGAGDGRLGCKNQPLASGDSDDAEPTSAAARTRPVDLAGLH